MDNQEKNQILTIENNIKKLTSRQKFLLYFYKSKQYFNNKWFIVRRKIISFVDSFYFYIISFSILVFFLHKILTYLNLTISDDNLYSFAFATAGIIGASIAIIFSFSTFILQSTADLFSTQYLNKFVNNAKEKIFFWLLVLLTIASFFTPFLFEKDVLEILVIILLIAFYLIYILYKELRERINPETTLKKIKKDAIKQLEKINKKYKKQANIQNKIFEYENNNKDFCLDIQYKVNRNWHLAVLGNVKFLFEIGLRLLAKNEINSFNLTLNYIHDIYLKHLDFRNGYFIRTLSSFLGTYTVDDEEFTIRILEYLQSLGDRIIQEKRKENIYYLLKVYESILSYSLNIKYADKNLGAHKENPLLNLISAYYIGLIEKLRESKDDNWIWESIKSISNVSNFILMKTDNYFIYSQISQIVNKISISCFEKMKDAFYSELINIYFNQIKISWNRHEHNDILWKNLFEELKKNIMLFSIIENNLDLSISNLFIDFQAWQVNITNWIIETKEEKEKKENLDKFIVLLKRWSDFLLDFARDNGLEEKKVGLSIIQSVSNNLKITHGIINRFRDKDLKKIYDTQFNTLSWYFQKTDKTEKSSLFNLEQALEILLIEISYNLKYKVFETGQLIDLYVRLIEQHFEKVTSGNGYNHPRVIEKLVYLGSILHKYKKDEHEKIIIAKIEELNKKYLEFNKQYFELKRKEKNFMWPDEFQLCKEIYDLENDLFSYNNSSLIGIKYILKEEITKDEWSSFTKKIKYCEGVEYKTERFF